ncbi:MAG: hypothetical protein KDA21_11310 [Phycisphaerales bacterium]|nr:hypothetical protein [Phycisphaerales bacterium]
MSWPDAEMQRLGPVQLDQWAEEADPERTAREREERRARRKAERLRLHGVGGGR